jgi:hypothetical protein
MNNPKVREIMKLKPPIFLYIPIETGVITDNICLYSIQNDLYELIKEISPINKIKARKGVKDYTISFIIKSKITEDIFNEFYKIITTYLNNTTDISQFYKEDGEIKYRQTNRTSPELKANNNELQGKRPAGRVQLKFIEDEN